MFGLSKSERATKALKSSLGIFLPGDQTSRDAIIRRSPDDTNAAVNDIIAGADPYETGAILVSLYIRASIATADDETRQRMLRKISSGNTEKLPRTLQFATHMVTVLAKLETGNKPLIPEGSTAEFLSSVAEGFSSQQSVKNKIASYLYKCAADVPDTPTNKAS